MPNLLNPLTTKFSLPAPSINDSVLTGKIDGTINWLDQNTLLNKPIDNVIYVTKNGKDTNNGKSLIFAKKTIKSALNAAKEGTTIIISSGYYEEYTPLICPPDVTITTQDLVQVKPINDSSDVFYLDSGTIINGITVINTRAPSCAFKLKSNIHLIKSPIIKNCSLVTGPFLNDNSLFTPNETIQIEGIQPTNLPLINNELIPNEKQINQVGAGTGILIDGNQIANESIENLVIVDSCNLFSQGGVGILVKNSAKCIATNCQTKFCATAYKTEMGGQLTLNSCASAYGDYSLYADGFNTNSIISGIVEEIIISELSISQVKVNSLLTQPIASSIIKINDNYYQISASTQLENNSSYISIVGLTDVEIGTNIEIYTNSKIIANNHYFEYIGSGITYNALYENNGYNNDNKKITENNNGVIYWSGVDASGVYKIGNIFEINQLTGELTTAPTVESLINIGAIGPLIRNGVPVGVLMKEISDNDQLISSTGEVDPFTVPTQTAIYNYLNNNYFSLSGGTIIGSTDIQDINITDNIISSVNNDQNIIISPNGDGSIDVASANIVNLAAPINDNDAVNKKFVIDLIQGGVAPPSIIPIIWGSTQDNGTLTLRSTQSLVKPLAGVILDDKIPSISVDTGTLVVDGGVGISGALNATTKSFDIEHPLDSNKRLRYGSLESPYHGIRLTGSGIIINGECIVDLPDYIYKLVKNEDVNVQITNIRHGQILWVDFIDIKNNRFVVKTAEHSNEYQFFWSLTAIRNDVDELIVEYIQT